MQREAVRAVPKGQGRGVNGVRAMGRDDLCEIKERIIAKCLLMENMGYFVGTCGNMSVRISGGFIVTPSKVPYAELTAEDLVTVSNQGAIISGRRLPSSEVRMHAAIYHNRKEIHAVIHGHSPYASALACLHRTIPPFIEDLVQIVGGEVKCTAYVPGGDHERMAQEVVNTLGSVNAVLIANHGWVCCGRELEEASVTSQIVEKAALMLLVATPLGPVLRIPDEAIVSERDRFLHKYGTQEDLPTRDDPSI